MVNTKIPVIYTKHLPKVGEGRDEVSPTIAGKISPTQLTAEESDAIKKGILGYCENHRLLYKKWALSHCVVPSIFPDESGPCKEW